MAPGAARAVDDGALIREAARGSNSAWEELVGRKEALVRAVARGFGLGPADVADVTQTIWLRVLSHIQRLDQVASINGWLVLTARREAMRVSMSRSRCAATGDASFDADGGCPHDDGRLPERSALNGERREAVRKAVGDLPEHQRRIVELFLSDPELRYDQVAAMAGVPVGSLGPTRRRALARLSRDADLLALR
jgi:RNA polymerase sigma factor (sigma-70 family)